MGNPFVHLELNTPDIPKSKDFYGELFGWEFNDLDLGGGTSYSAFRTQEGVTGGIWTSPGSPNMWLPYVGVENIQEATKKAVALGASIQRGPQEVPQVGWLTLLADPTGVTIALWQDIRGLNV